MSLRCNVRIRFLFFLLTAIALWSLFLPLRAEEGFWLYSQAPVDEIARKFGLRLTPEWLEHIEKSTVRFNSKRFDEYIGGSGSFVSADGLVLTNRHVIPRHVWSQLDGPDRNLGRDGFVAQTVENELRLPGVSLDAVISHQDVTERVMAAAPASTIGADGDRARRDTMDEIERSASKAPGTSAEVVALDAGARYLLYVHRRYSDIRLVFAPEAAVAQRREDHPAPAFDVALVRAYENDVPARPGQFLKLSVRAPADGERIFVSGAPTQSNRHATVAELEAQRDVELPLWVEAYAKLHYRLAAFAAREAEQAQAPAHQLGNIAFIQRIAEDRLSALRDVRLLAERRDGERRLLDALAQRGDDKSIRAFRTIREIASQNAESTFRAELLSLGESPPWQRGVQRGLTILPFGLEYASPLYAFGEVLLKLQRQRELPEKERDKGYREEDRLDLENWLFDTERLDMRIEAVRLKAFFDTLVETLGADHPVTKIALVGESSAKKADQLTRGTRLADRDFRRSLYNSDRAAFDATSDPLLDMLRAIEREQGRTADARAARHAVLAFEGASVRRAAAWIQGNSTYPDATRTARFGFGVVGGWRQRGAIVPHASSIGAFYDRTNRDSSEPPYALPAKWARAGERIDRAVILDFVSTADSVAGHSGSATVDAEGNLVGIVFGPGAVEGATLADCAYEAGKPRRTAHVAAAAIIEGLAKVYDAPQLVRELLAR